MPGIHQDHHGILVQIKRLQRAADPHGLLHQLRERDLLVLIRKRDLIRETFRGALKVFETVVHFVVRFHRISLPAIDGYMYINIIQEKTAQSIRISQTITVSAPSMASWIRASLSSFSSPSWVFSILGWVAGCFGVKTVQQSS